MYEYLIGSLIFGVVWLFLFISKKNLRKPMLWTAGVYIIFSAILVSIWYFLRNYIYLGDTIVPSYWHPTTLFNLGTVTGFAGIEDILFLIFIGGIATAIYEFIHKKEIKLKKTYKPHLKAFGIAFIAFFFFLYLFPINLIYALIFSNFMGAVILVLERKDLIMHSFIGGLSFLVVYILIFLLFLIISPS